MIAKLIDDWSRVVLLLLGRNAFAFVKNQLLLLFGVFALPGLGNGHDVLSAAAVLNDLLRRLAFVIEFPVTSGTFIGGVEDRLLEESIIHVKVLSKYSR